MNDIERAKLLKKAKYYEEMSETLLGVADSVPLEDATIHKLIVEAAERAHNKCWSLRSLAK